MRIPTVLAIVLPLVAGCAEPAPQSYLDVSGELSDDDGLSRMNAYWWDVETDEYTVRSLFFVEEASCDAVREFHQARMSIPNQYEASTEPYAEAMDATRADFAPGFPYWDGAWDLHSSIDGPTALGPQHVDDGAAGTLSVNLHRWYSEPDESPRYVARDRYQAIGSSAEPRGEITTWDDEIVAGWVEVTALWQAVDGTGAQGDRTITLDWSATRCTWWPIED